MNRTMRSPRSRAKTNRNRRRDGYGVYRITEPLTFEKWQEAVAWGRRHGRSARLVIIPLSADAAMTELRKIGGAGVLMSGWRGGNRSHVFNLLKAAGAQNAKEKP